jgi:hypothetical protein
MEQQPAHYLSRMYDQKSDTQRTSQRVEAVLPAQSQHLPVSLERSPLCIHEENTEVYDSISHHDTRDSTCLEPVARPDSRGQAAVNTEDILLDVDESERRVASASETAQASEAAAPGAAPTARHDITAGGSDVDKGAGVCSHLRVVQLVQVTCICVHVLLVCLTIAQNPSWNPGNLIECEKISYQISKMQNDSKKN